MKKVLIFVLYPPVLLIIILSAIFRKTGDLLWNSVDALDNLMEKL